MACCGGSERDNKIGCELLPFISSDDLCFQPLVVVDWQRLEFPFEKQGTGFDLKSIDRNTAIVEFSGKFHNGISRGPEVKADAIMFDEDARSTSGGGSELAPLMEGCL